MIDVLNLWFVNDIVIFVFFWIESKFLFVVVKFVFNFFKIRCLGSDLNMFFDIKFRDELVLIKKINFFWIKFNFYKLIIFWNRI